MLRSIRSAVGDEGGATTFEYTIMLVLAAIALTVLVGLIVTGNLL